MPQDELNDVVPVDREDYRRHSMTAAEYAVEQFLDSLTVPANAQIWLDTLADGDAATSNPDVAQARQDTFI